MPHINKVRFIGWLLLALLGAVAAFYPFSPAIPDPSELISTSGILKSAKFRSKVGSEFELEGAGRSFVYRSFGRLCGNVHDQLLAEVGKPVSIKYLPTPTAGRSGSLRVFDIAGHQSPICTYDQVAAMIKSDFKGLALLGYLMLFAGSANLFSVLSAVRRGAGSRNGKQT